ASRRRAYPSSRRRRRRASRDRAEHVVRASTNRVDDDDDQTYDFESWSAEALASWAFAGQEFGTAEDGALFTLTGGGTDPVSGATSGGPGTDIAFARFGSEFGTIDVTTDPTDNPGGLDHVVTYTYTIDGVAAENTYLLFFEDANETSPFFDFDYNDLVVEVTGVVPEPGSLALISLGALAIMSRRRK
ncbi:MAG: PEP-CTERM sorting domain-containing protein, partial [Phycisphaeraceae bacterium]